jgi:hypothetical protein
MWRNRGWLASAANREELAASRNDLAQDAALHLRTASCTSA